MSALDDNSNDSVCAWVLVHFVDCDPGKEFEIIERNRISITDDVVLRARLKVKVFYGKAKVEAYVVQESADFEYLHTNLKALTRDYTYSMLRVCTFAGGKRRSQQENIEMPNKDVPATTGAAHPDFYHGLHEKYNALKVKFDDLYRIQCGMRTTIDVLVDAVEVLTDKAKRRTTRSSRRRRSATNEDSEVNELEADGAMLIGEHKTAIPNAVFNSIDWTRCSAATRKLLVAVFSKSVLATHTLTGKPSPAFLNAGKERKEQLDPCKTADIINIVTRRCGVSASAVRNAITTKCADENKMSKKRKRV